VTATGSQAPREAAASTSRLSSSFSQVPPTDPVFAQQWHLDNPVNGLLDLNVLTAWDDYTGAGVEVWVFDDGFDYLHPDLVANYDATRDIDLESGDSDAAPALPFDNHGTACMGIIGAARNGTGAVGVAYDATLVGIRGYTDDASAPTSIDDYVINLGTGITGAAAGGGDVISMSNGVAGGTNYFNQNLDAVIVGQTVADIIDAAATGRDGLGLNMVKSAGNSRVTNWDTNMSAVDNMAEIISVAAVDQDGFVSSYSSFGAAILVSGFGTPGEVVTTDRTGPDGYDLADFTSTFNGTSAAAPMVAGVVALMLEANADLGWRDVQDILASSAVTVGSGTNGAGNAVAGDERYQWLANGAERWNGGGMVFSNDYGFGLVDATAAVRLAETWFTGGQGARTSANQDVLASDMLNAPLAIPDNNLTGAAVNGSFTAGSGFEIEYTTVTVTMSPNHTFMGDLRIVITSASGLQSILHDRGGETADFPGTWTFMTRAFRGETAGGIWSVQFTDLAGGDTGTLTDVAVEHHGQAALTDNVHVFTNQYSNFASASGRDAVTDTNSGIDTINAAAVTTASVIRLNGGTSTIDGVSVTISSNFENAIGGDGNDTLTGNNGSNVLHGGRGNDGLSGGSTGGSDTLIGGAGNDTYTVFNGADILTETAGQGMADEVLADVAFVLAADDDIEILSTILISGTATINLTGNALAQQIFGNAGANVLSDGGGAGADTITGAAGSDTYVIGNSGTVIVEAATFGTNDRVQTSVSFALAADDDIERMSTTLASGTTAIDLTGNAVAQDITGNAGANVLSDGGGAGADTLTGLAGNDNYIVRNAGTLIVEAAGGGTADRVSAAVSFVLAANDDIETMTTTSAGGTTAINLTGNAAVQAITGNAGINVLSDGGGTGADTLTGLAGNDTYIVRNAGTLIVEGAGQGTADRVAVALSFALAADDDIETLDTTSAAGTTTINLTGNAAAQGITGNAGVNVLSDGGGAGADTLTGLAGNDTYVVGNAGTLIVEGAGQGTADRVQASLSFALAGDDDIEILETTSAAGSTAIDLTGNAVAQTITGNAGVNTLSDGGGAGADTLTGIAGNDTYIVGNSGTVLVEAAAQGTADRVQASVSFALASDDDIEIIETTSAAGTTAINLTGNAVAQTITGNAGVNALSDGGGAGVDTLTGFAGSDTYIVGNAGTVIVEAATFGTADRVQASVSFTLAADDDIELMSTTLASGTTAINLTGNAAAQDITGNAGANVLSDGGGAGVDTLTGLAGNDTYIVRNAGALIVEGAGQGTADRVAAAVSFVLDADDDIEILTTTSSGGTTAIDLTGNAVAQAITGNAGVNTLSDGGGAGADTLTGLAGNDIYVVGNSGTVLVEGTGQGTADRVQASVSFALASDDDIEIIETTAAAGTTAINLTGNAVAQAITGNAGVNQLSDGGGAGADTLTGLAGDDTYVVGSATTQIVEVAGGGTADRVLAVASFALAADDHIEIMATASAAGVTAINLTGNALAQTITGNAGVNTLSDGGGAGADTLTGLAGNDTYVVGNAGTLIVEATGQGTADRVQASVSFALAADDDIETMETTSAAGTTAIDLTGNAVAQGITGNAGVNALSDGGGAGADTLTGFAGNDTYVVGNAGTVIVEVAAQGTADRVQASVSFALASDDNIEIIETTAAAGTTAINLTGNAVAQAITGNAGVNTLSDGGGAGADTLTGLAGNDTYIVRNTGTLIVEAAGGGTADRVAAAVSFVLAADDDIESLTTSSAGGTAAINLTGNALAQTITGNTGLNVINGLGGLDTLSGGTGSDTFVFSTALGAGNIDTITDFNVVADTIRLENAIFSGLANGALAAAAFAANATGLAGDATDRIIYNTASGGLFFDADGLGGSAAVQFAALDAALALTQADFFVI